MAVPEAEPEGRREPHPHAAATQYRPPHADAFGERVTVRWSVRGSITEVCTASAPTPTEIARPSPISRDAPSSVETPNMYSPRQRVVRGSRTRITYSCPTFSMVPWGRLKVGCIDQLVSCTGPLKNRWTRSERNRKKPAGSKMSRSVSASILRGAARSVISLSTWALIMVANDQAAGWATSCCAYHSVSRADTMPLPSRWNW